MKWDCGQCMVDPNLTSRPDLLDVGAMVAYNTTERTGGQGTLARWHAGTLAQAQAGKIDIFKPPAASEPSR